MMKTITKISRAKFKVITDGVSNSELELDFNPLSEEFKLHGDYLLIHWQAKPKGYRQWGIYSSMTDSYISVKAITLDRSLGETLQLDDQTANSVPSAVIKVRNARLVLIDDRAIICTRQQLIDVNIAA